MVDESTNLLPRKAPVQATEPSLSFLKTFYINIFFACVSFSIIMPSLAPYLETMGGDTHFLAWVVSGYSLGEAFGSIAFGWLYNYCRDIRGLGPRFVLLFCIALGVVGSVMYLAADSFQNKYLVLWGRFIQGLWTGGQQTLEQAYVADVVPLNRRTELTSTLGSFAVLGFIMGPSFGAMFCTTFYIGGVEFTPYNAPGAFILLMGLLMLAASFVTFHPAALPPIKQVAATSPSSRGERSSSSSSRSGVRPPSTVGVWVCLLLFFVHCYSFAIQETIATPLVIALYNWDQVHVNLMFVATGLLSLITSITSSYASRWWSDFTLLVVSLLLGLLASLLLIDWEGSLPLPQFYLGFALLSVAFPLGRNVGLSVYSQVIGPVPQGAYMGAMLAMGAVPRMLGPFWAVESLLLPCPDCEVPRTWLEFGFNGGLFVVSLAAMLLCGRALRPHPDTEDADPASFSSVDDVDLPEERVDPQSPFSSAAAASEALVSPMRRAGLLQRRTSYPGDELP